MLLLYYRLMVLLALFLTGTCMFIWHKHFDVHIALLAAIVPISNLGYLLLAESQSLEAALLAIKMTYIGGCYLPLTVMIVIFGQCQLHFSRTLRVELMALTSLVYLTVLTVGKGPLFYAGATLGRVLDASVLTDKQYGPMHTVFQTMTFGYVACSLGAIIYSYFKQKQVSRRLLALLCIPMVCGCGIFFFLKKLLPGVDLMPAVYNLGLLLYLVTSSRLRLYDISDSAIDSLVQTGDTGLISVDLRGRYLGSNETAKEIFPALRELTVDAPINSNPGMQSELLPWLRSFRENEGQNKQTYACGGRTYLVTVGWLSDGVRRQGYQIYLTDDTKNQNYIHLLNCYNTQLREEVEEKTAHITEMHDKLVLGMATMVESRDNSTGGHIRRTSDGVRILVEEMSGEAGPLQDEKFREDVIKAAPMHDLGKIAVDDDVLRKPGRYTAEEYEQMKRHAAEGARIVHEILAGTDDEQFRRIAENVAHYHHERWDGSGYPEGLRGEQIPLKARIMAIADVYDALVSRRVYKDRMSFEQANTIILEGMGSQFDRGLEIYYRLARPRLEQYYSGVQ